MPRVNYETWKPGPDALAVVRQAIAIADEYQAQGYDLTLRQLYYQFVARGLIPNNDRSYKRLGEIVNRGRMAGLIDWDYISDRTRNLRSIGHYADPAAMVDVAARAYALDLWANQPTRVEVWVEKEALAGVVAQAADAWDCAYFACRGYVSQSEQWAAAQRLRKYIERGQSVVIVHLGDHDPSGIDMTRDIEERIRRFIYTDVYQQRGGKATGWEPRFDVIEERIRESFTEGRDPFVVNRIALNMDQVEQYDPPPNPAKITDSRAGKYMNEFGDQSWELDALSPATLDNLIQEAIREHVDEDRFEAMRERMEDERSVLTACSVRWPEVAQLLEGGQ